MMNLEDLPSFNPEQEGLADTRRKELADVLARFVPECVEEDQLNFEKLKEALTDIEPNEEDEAFERFELNWAGKSQAKRLASKRSTATLVPVKGDGVDEESTRNLLIEGDNLEVLKVLKDTYKGKVDMIYIDPPYNIDVDGVYEDDFEEPLQGYLKSTGALDENEHITTTEGSSTRQSGRKHSRWLSMMYPRLQLMKQLLKMGGVICVSIDDKEVANLRLLMDEVFGEDNFVDTHIWQSNFRPDNGDRFFRKNAEFILVYTSDKLKIVNDFRVVKSEKSGLPSLTKSSDSKKTLLFNPESVEIHLEDGIYKKGVKTSYELLDDVEVVGGKAQSPFRLLGNVIWTQSYLDEQCLAGTQIIIKTTDFVPYYLKAGDGFLAPLKFNLIDSDSAKDIQFANASTISIFDGLEIFKYPKPFTLISTLLQFQNKDATILDCFAGSGTTGHAVMKLNAEDGGTRRYICTQLPDKIDLTKGDVKQRQTKQRACDFLDSIAKPRTIAEITKERLRRAGAKIRQEHPDFHGDLGFKVFKLADSTIAPKHRHYSNRGDFENEARTIASQNQERLLYSTQTDPYAIAWEVAIKHGYELTETLSPIKLGNLTGYAIFPPKPEERRALHQPKLLVIPKGVLNGKEDIWAFTRDLQGAFPSHHFVLWEGLFQGNDSFKRSVMDAILAFKDQLTDVKGNPAHTQQLRIEVIRL